MGEIHREIERERVSEDIYSSCLCETPLGSLKGSESDTEELCRGTQNPNLLTYKIQLSLSLSLRSLPVPGWIMWLVTWLTSSSWRTHPLFRWRWECWWRSSQIFGMKYSLTDTHTHTEPDVSLQGAAETWPVTQHYLFGPSTPWAFHHYYKCRAGGRKRADLNSVRHRRTSLRNKWPSRPRPLPVSAEQLFFTTPFTFLNS